jgi:dihydroorotase
MSVLASADSRLFLRETGVRPYHACPQLFCKPCIKNLAGATYLEEEVDDKEEWTCFCCDPAPIAHLKPS